MLEETVIQSFIFEIWNYRSLHLVLGRVPLIFKSLMKRISHCWKKLTVENENDTDVFNKRQLFCLFVKIAWNLQKFGNFKDFLKNLFVNTI